MRENFWSVSFLQEGRLEEVQNISSYLKGGSEHAYEIVSDCWIDLAQPDGLQRRWGCRSFRQPGRACYRSSSGNPLVRLERLSSTKTDRRKGEKESLGLAKDRSSFLLGQDSYLWRKTR